MSTMQIEIHDPRTQYTSGERVRGEVVLKLDKETKCNAFSAELAWQTHGKGNTDRKAVATQAMETGERLPAGTHRLPFEFEFPAGPYTYHGHYINLDWQVSARLDIPWAIDLTAEQPLLCGPPERLSAPLPLEEQPTAHKSERGGAFLVLGAIIMIVSMIPILIALNDSDAEGGFACGLSSLIVGVLLVHHGAKRKMASHLIQEPHIWLDPWPLAPGTTSLYTLTFTPGRDITLNGIFLTFTGQERATHGTGSDRSTSTHTLHEETFTLTPKTHLKKGQSARFTLDVQLPHDAPVTFDYGDNEIVWKIRTQIDIPNWPDWDDEHALVVVPRAHLPPPTPQTAPTTTPQGPAW